MGDRELLLKKLNSLNSHLLNMAIGDGKVTIDERNLLNAVSYSVTKLEDAIDEVFEDGIVTSDEKKRLKSLIQEIGDDAITTSEFDDTVSSEEEALLRNLQIAVENLKQNVDEL